MWVSGQQVPHENGGPTGCGQGMRRLCGMGFLFCFLIECQACLLVHICIACMALVWQKIGLNTGHLTFSEVTTHRERSQPRKKKNVFILLLGFLHGLVIDLWVESALKNFRLRVHTLESDKISVDTVFYWITPCEMNVFYVNIPSLISFIMLNSRTHGYVFFFTLERSVNSLWNLIFITHIGIFI